MGIGKLGIQVNGDRAIRAIGNSINWDSGKQDSDNWEFGDLGWEFGELGIGNRTIGIR